jgi:hypothetical protein
MQPGCFARSRMPHQAKQYAPRTLARLPGGALWRQPWPAEAGWFYNHPHVAGFAAGRASVVLNPHIRRRPSALSSVLINEAVRLLLQRTRRLVGRLPLTPTQRRRFRDYGSPQDQVDTVLARIVAHDRSAGRPNTAQLSAARLILQALKLHTASGGRQRLLQATLRHTSLSRSAGPCKPVERAREVARIVALPSPHGRTEP